MRKFDLVSVDWDSVRLMQAGQFKQETFYLEELVRWSLQRGRVVGLLNLVEDGISRPSPEGDRLYSVTVRGCQAVGASGQIIDIPDESALALKGTVEAAATIVPLYVGVSKSERDPEPQLYSSVDTGLIGCRGLRRLYKLSSDSSDASMDWVQIGQFEKTALGLALDRDFFPETLFLSSHAGLWRAQQTLRALARQGLELLVRHSSAAIQRYGVAATLAGSLGPAARAADDRTYPRAYFDQLSGILAAQRAQLLVLPAPSLRVYQEAVDGLEETLAYLETADWTLGQAFLMVRECLERLIRLYPPLLESLEAAAPQPERRLLDHETVAVAQEPRRGHPEEERPDSEPPQRTRIFMRRKLGS